MPGSDRPSPLSVSIGLATKLSTIGLEFALPMLLGVYLDKKWKTEPVLLLVGMTLGLAIGFFHVFRIARDASKPK